MRFSCAISRFLLVGCIVSAAVPFAYGQGGGGPGGGGPGGAGGGRGGFGGMMGGGGGMGGMASLLMIKEVRDELKVEESQKSTLEAFTKDLMTEAGVGGGRGAFGGGAGGGPPDMSKMREMMATMQAKMAEIQVKTEEKLADVLDPDQMDRLVGLYIQRDGVRSLSSKTVAVSLKITDAQKSSIAEIEKAQTEEMGSLFGGGGRGGAGGGGPGGGGRGGPGGGGEDIRAKIEKMRKDTEEKIMGVLTATQKDEMEKLKGAKFEFPAQQRGPRPGTPQ